jgi:dTDP-4-dehydrorhamnose reductase
MTGCDLPELDISDARSVSTICDEAQPDLIINAAAYTDVEAAEENPDDAFRVNEIGAAVVAEAADARETPVVYYSTDFVFRGEAGRSEPYEPDDAIAPESVYGKSKAAGEKATRNAAARHFILRTAWLYGPGGNNFVEKIVAAGATRPDLKVIDDEVGSPTHTHDLAEVTRAICQTKAYGTYHAVNAGACSRYDFAVACLRHAGLDTPVHRAKAADMTFKAKRPHYAVLSASKIEYASGYTMRPWQEALAHYMKRREMV